MGNVLDDVTDEKVDETHIRQRVEDWEKRLYSLYDMIKGWLPDGWTARKGTPVGMHEQLMRQFGIETKQLPTLECVNQEGAVVRLEPRALWIIGGNGRVDLKFGARHYLIVDLAENFGAPDWRASPADRRCDREMVSSDWLGRVLR